MGLQHINCAHNAKLGCVMQKMEVGTANLISFIHHFGPYVLKCSHFKSLHTSTFQLIHVNLRLIAVFYRVKKFIIISVGDL